MYTKGWRTKAWIKARDAMYGSPEKRSKETLEERIKKMEVEMEIGFKEMKKEHTEQMSSVYNVRSLCR